MCCDFRWSLQHLGRDLSLWRCVVERLSVVEREELWDRYESGESQRSISRRLGRSPSTIRTHLVSAGWKRPVPVGEWCSLRLSLADREEISRGLACDESLRSIAYRLGRSPPPCRGRSRPMVAEIGIGPQWHIGRRGGERHSVRTQGRPSPTRLRSLRARRVDRRWAPGSDARLVPAGRIHADHWRRTWTLHLR
jgi:hypothetical protein